VHLEGVLYRSGQMWGVLAGGTLLAVMGLIDDLRNLPWPPRLLLQANYLEQVPVDRHGAPGRALYL
jgi:UDP-N-acetylmuramyl pentapeptide phosphotransferase/UDP-N-acetylglucosamine-1-phosphate transferase